MYHTIEFAKEIVADLETSPKHPLQKVRIPKGTRLKAQIKPYVVEGTRSPIEVADLFFADGTATRRIPFRFLTLVD